MRKLLSAECFRLRKSWLFYLLLIAAVFISIQLFQEERSQAAYEAADTAVWAMDEAFFQFSIMSGILLAVFLPLHLGVDYSDGTIRNKLTDGHKRTDVYLSGLGIAFLSTLLLTLMCLALHTGMGVFTQGQIDMEGGQFALYLLSAVCCSLAFASIYTAISMLCSNRAFALAACIALFMVMTPICGGLESDLRQAEIARNVLAIVDGKPVFGEPYPNPFYISGIKRTIYEFLYDFLPSGQGAQLSNLEAERLGRLPALSLLFTLLTSGAGLLAFARKDIK